MLKQNVARELRDRAHGGPFWLERYYDFNVDSERKRVEKLRYIRGNPVTRGLVMNPEDWEWSSYRHYVLGVGGSGRNRVAVDGAQAGADGSISAGQDTTSVVESPSRKKPRPVPSKNGGTRTGHPPHRRTSTPTPPEIDAPRGSA
jgi:hypothetical protein